MTKIDQLAAFDEIPCGNIIIIYYLKMVENIYRQNIAARYTGEINRIENILTDKLHLEKV